MNKFAPIFSNENVNGENTTATERMRYPSEIFNVSEVSHRLLKWRMNIVPIVILHLFKYCGGCVTLPMGRNTTTNE